MAGLCATNIVWLQVAPLAFSHIGWKFYLCFVIPGSICGLIIWIFFPETRGVPLESIAAIFGDSAELYDFTLRETHDVEQAEIEIATKSDGVTTSHHFENV